MNTSVNTKGKILISTPLLTQSFFSQSVVLMAAHDEDGAMGFIINKGVGANLKDAIDTSIDTPLYIGGPVSPNMMFVVMKREHVSHFDHYRMINDDFVTDVNIDLLLSLLKVKVIPLRDTRFFLGYSGWSKGQLEDEIEEGSWGYHDFDGSSEFIHRKKTSLWRQEILKGDPQYWMWSNTVTHPFLN